VTSPPFDTPWLAPESPDLVWFSGADAVRFLNDLISQEVSDMTSGEARRSLLLGPQGKLDFLLWVLRDGDRIGLVTDPGRGADLAATLDRYRIRVEVDIEQETAGVWLVMGEWDGFDVSWPDVGRHLVIGGRPDLPTGAEEDYERLRVLSGEPRWGRDVDEGTIPHESGLVRSSVDFTKGCYLGQELVARIDSRGGNVPRRLLILDAGERLIDVGSTLTAAGKEVGVVTSATDGLGLAMVRREVSVGDEVIVGGGPAVVRELPSR
jgi:folate-binding protein YgfZ